MSNPSKRITLIGFGLMGAQISQVLAQHGYYVLAYDISRERLENGLLLVRAGRYGLENSISRGKIDSLEAKKILECIETTTSLDYALAGADFVIEAAVEDLSVKQGIFKRATVQASQSAVLATNTSTLSITMISSGLPIDASGRVVGMHFFNPPQVMKLVEVVKSNETSDETVKRVIALAIDLGKVPVTVLDYPGFVANRIGLSVFAEASELLAKGIASVRDIDLAMRLGYGYPLGPFELGDLVGLDSRLLNMEALCKETQNERFRPPAILKKLVSEGFLGDPKIKKGSKGGYYEYFGLKRPDGA
ncbi:MAG: 3-hydroxyacyl-CoA dehydrogenase family protein [Nitrososphaerales archaeon]